MAYRVVSVSVFVSTNKKATVSGGPSLFTPHEQTGYGFNQRVALICAPVREFLSNQFPLVGLSLSGATLAKEWGPTEPRAM